MEVKLYITEDSESTINKDLLFVAAIDINLRDTQSISAPVLLLSEVPGVDLKTVNYAYMEEFERFYFIRSTDVGADNIYTLVLECDVIESYRDDILNASAEISRGIKEGDYGDVSALSEVRREVDVFESDKGFIGEESIIFSTIGQDIEGEV